MNLLLGTFSQCRKQGSQLCVSAFFILLQMTMTMTYLAQLWYPYLSHGNLIPLDPVLPPGSQGFLKQ